MVGIRYTEGVHPSKETKLKEEYTKLKEKNDPQELAQWFLDGEIDVVEMWHKDDGFRGYAGRINAFLIYDPDTKKCIFPDVESGFIAAFKFLLQQKIHIKND